MGRIKYRLEEITNTATIAIPKRTFVFGKASFPFVPFDMMSIAKALHDYIVIVKNREGDQTTW